jgi:hypothetical protein
MRPPTATTGAKRWRIGVDASGIGHVQPNLIERVGCAQPNPRIRMAEQIGSRGEGATVYMGLAGKPKAAHDGGDEQKNAAVSHQPSFRREHFHKSTGLDRFEAVVFRSWLKYPMVAHCRTDAREMTRR